jgi:ubiquinone/menaquinone biosynthesis C-methylase UbiE
MNAEKRDFDKESASWDENPARVKLAHDVAYAILNQIVLTRGMDIMDFGCGTGLLTFQFLPFVRSVIGVDSSRGMLDIFNMKASKLKLNNVKAALIDLDMDDTLAGNYNLILSNMTLHHIKEIKPLFDQFYRITAPDGYLCIADLDLDNGQFHGDNAGVFHFGFDRDFLRGVFTRAGYKHVSDIDAAEVVKPDRDGEMKRFTVFLITGQKELD